MISVQGVSMRFGSKVLFDDVTTTFSAGRRYGLTGPNGAGKSTFMKLLTGEQPPQKGTVVRPAKVGVLRQDQFAFDQFRVVDTVVMGNHKLWSALQERELLYAKTEMTNAEGMRLGELEGIVGDEDGYEADANAAILLQGLDIPESVHDRTMSELQGGQKVRVLLAQALFGKPQALLLDEPTNHLDLDSIHWVREFLLRYEGTLIVISHDRHFLNGVCTHTADIDYQTIITYTGGYDDMVLAKMAIRTRVENENEQREKKIEQLQDFIAGVNGAAADENHRRLAACDQRRGGLDAFAVGLRRRKRFERFCRAGFGALREHVPWHFQRDRAAAARQHFLERARDQRRCGVRIFDAVGPFYERAQRRKLVRHLVQMAAALAEECRRHLSGQAQHRLVGSERSQKRGTGVEHAGAGHHAEYAGLAGGSRIAFRGMDGSLLVAHEDVAQGILLEEFVIKRKHGTAGIAENHIDALIEQRLDDNPRAGQLLARHGTSSFATAR